MPKITEAELLTQLKTQKYSNFYLIIGKDNYLKYKYADRLSSATAGKTLPELNLQKLDGKKLSVQELLDQTDQLPVMADYRCVTVTDYDAGAKLKGEYDDFVSIIKNLPESTVLILLLDTIEFDKKKGNWASLMRTAEKYGSVIECNYKSDAEVIKYISDWSEKSKVVFDKSVARYLIETCGKDLQKLKTEVAKLCIYKKDGYVSKEDIDRLSAKTPEATIYMLPKAVFSENIGKSLNVLSDLLDMRMESYTILNSLADSFIDVYRVKCALDDGKKPTDIAGDFGYSQNREFVLTNSAYSAKKLSFTVLSRCFKIICDAERQLNTFVVNNKRLLLEKTIILLIETMRGYKYKV